MNNSYAMITSKKRNYYEMLYNKEKYWRNNCEISKKSINIMHS